MITTWKMHCICYQFTVAINKGKICVRLKRVNSHLKVVHGRSRNRKPQICRYDNIFHIGYAIINSSSFYYAVSIIKYVLLPFSHHCQRYFYKLAMLSKSSIHLNCICTCAYVHMISARLACIFFTSMYYLFVHVYEVY